MSQLKYRIVFALVIPVFLFNLTTNALFGVAHAIEESGQSNARSVKIFNVFTGDNCPACPDHHQENTEHSHSSCEHHSSLYVAGQSLLLSYNPNISTHFLDDPFKAIPEVFLDKFIPPQNHA